MGAIWHIWYQSSLWHQKGSHSSRIHFHVQYFKRRTKLHSDLWQTGLKMFCCKMHIQVLTSNFQTYYICCRLVLPVTLTRASKLEEVLTLRLYSNTSWIRTMSHRALFYWPNSVLFLCSRCWCKHRRSSSCTVTPASVFWVSRSPAGRVTFSQWFARWFWFLVCAALQASWSTN